MSTLRIFHDIPFTHEFLSKYHDCYGDEYHPIKETHWSVSEWVSKNFPSVTRVRISTKWLIKGVDVKDNTIFEFTIDSNTRYQQSTDHRAIAVRVSNELIPATPNVKAWDDSIAYTFACRHDDDSFIVKTYDSDRRLLFRWRVRQFDPMLLRRLYQIHGENVIPVEMIPEEFRITERMTLRMADDGAMIVNTGGRFAKWCPIILNVEPITVELLSKNINLEGLKYIHWKIKSWQVRGDTVYTYDKDKKRLLVWKLPEHVDPLLFSRLYDIHGDAHIKPAPQALCKLGNNSLIIHRHGNELSVQGFKDNVETTYKYTVGYVPCAIKHTDLVFKNTHELSKFHPRAKSYTVSNERVVSLFDENNDMLFQWKLPEKPKVDPLLIFRLYMIYGIVPIPNDELADELKDLGFNCVSLQCRKNTITVYNNGDAENVEVEVPQDARWIQHIDLVFDRDPELWTVVESGSKIHQFHPRIKFYQVRKGQVTLKDENWKILFRWRMLDPVLICRLYDIYGQVSLTTDLVGSILSKRKGDKLHVTHNNREYFIDYTPSLVKHTDAAVCELLAKTYHDVFVNVTEDSILKKLYSGIDRFMIEKGRVKMYDKDYNPLFAWTLPEVKKELNPVLVSRLFDVYGEKLFMSDLLDPKTTNPRAVAIRREGDKLRVENRVVDYVPSRVKHTDVEICRLLAKSPRGFVTEDSILKDFYSEIDSYQVGEYVTVFNIKGEKLFSWNLPEVKEELDPLLLYRLYETQGGNLAGKQIPWAIRKRADFDDSDSINIAYMRSTGTIVVQGYRCYNQTKFNHAIEYEEPRLKITDLSFDHVTKNQLTWSTPIMKEYYPSIISFMVTDTSVKFFDGQDELLFTWELPLNTVLFSRLFDVYGENPIMSDLLEDPSVGILRYNDKVLGVGTRYIDYVPSRVKHTDVEICNLLAKSPRGILVVITDVSILKAFYSEIESYRIDDGYVTMYDIKGRKLFAWMLSPGKPAVTRKEIEDLQKMYGTELFSLRKGPKQVAEWSEKNFPHVNYLRVCDGSLAGYKYYEPVFSIDIEK